MEWRKGKLLLISPSILVLLCFINQKGWCSSYVRIHSFDMKIVLFPALWRLRQKDGDVGANLDYTAMLSFQKQSKNQTLKSPPKSRKDLGLLCNNPTLLWAGMCLKGRSMLCLWRAISLVLTVLQQSRPALIHYRVHCGAVMVTARSTAEISSYY